MIKINKKFFIFISVILILLFMILFVTDSVNKFRINNLDTYLKTVPSDQKDRVNYGLYNILDKKNIKDANIRDNSYSEKFNSNEKTYSSVFIVDIPSIEESYKINLNWVKDNNIIIKGDSLKFSCLMGDEIIYNNTTCNTKLNLPVINTDPIIQFLPQSTFNYKIILKSTTGSKVSLNINIYLYSSDTREGNAEASIAKYKNQVLDWFKLKNLDINNYDINYIIN